MNASRTSTWVALASEVVSPHAAVGTIGVVGCGAQITGFHHPNDHLPANATIHDFRPYVLAPGAIDLHVHGGDGVDCASTDTDGIRRFGQFRATTGTTGALATIALPWDDLIHQIATYGRWRADGALDHAMVLGVHIEGPFLNPRRMGALPLSSLRAPSVRDVEHLLDIGCGVIRMMTIAPELPGALAVIEALVRHNVVASIGHTDATYDEIGDAVRAGARKSTHTFNAMRPFSHRDPGAVGGVLMNRDLVAELIADGHHVHPAALALLIKIKGVNNVALVTDNVPQAGLPDGVYRTGTYGDLPMVIRDGVAHLAQADGTPSATISGSIGTLGSHLRLLHDLPDLGLTVPDLFTMASTVPARLLGLTDRGVIATDTRADFGIWDTSTFRCLATMVAGKVVYQDLDHLAQSANA